MTNSGNIERTSSIHKIWVAWSVASLLKVGLGQRPCLTRMAQTEEEVARVFRNHQVVSETHTQTELSIVRYDAQGGCLICDAPENRVQVRCVLFQNTADW